MIEAPLQIFPALDSATEAALSFSIERFGVLVPVAKDQHGRILDGHHRSAIADRLGVTYRVDVISVADDDEAREIARTLNTDRRQLDPEQRRQVVVAMREAEHSTTAIAGALGVSDETIRRDLSGSTYVEPDRVRGVDGKSYPARRPTVIAAKNPREAERAQTALAGTDLPSVPVLDVKRVERISREQEAERRRGQPIETDATVNDIATRHGDFRQSLTDLFGTVDAIITDPPYGREFLDEFDALGAAAALLLKPGGLLVAMVGGAYLPEYLTRLGGHLPYRWCGAYLTDGPAARIQDRRVGTKWKPLLIFGGTEFIAQDVFQSRGDDKEHHHWGQSESGMADIVSRLTEPGQLVVDPFLGGGTTAVVCRALGRRFVGCDVDAAAVAATRERLAA